MSIKHAFSNTVADAAGTITVWNGATTASVAATDVVRPGDWNSGHNQFHTLSGNTNNASTASGTNVVLQGLGQVTLVGSTDTIGISVAPLFTHSGFDPYSNGVGVVTAFQGASLQINPVTLPNVQFDRVVVYPYNSNSSNSSGSHTISFWAGIYSRNASSLSLIQSVSRSHGVTQSGTAGSYSLFSGMRLMTMGLTTTLTEGQYWLGFISRTSTAGANGTWQVLHRSDVTLALNGHIGSSNATTQQEILGRGLYSATTTGMPGSIAFTEIQGSDNLAHRMPVMRFASSTI